MLPTPPPPLLVFDLDGTLADSAPDLVATLNIILDQEGLPPIPLAHARTMVGAGARALIERGLAANGQTAAAARLDQLLKRFLDHYEAHIADHTRLFPGVGEALDRFEAAGWDFAVCTNKLERPSIMLLSALGCADRFRAICGQDTFSIGGKPLPKPDARALLFTITKAGGDPARTVMIGDSRTDIATAKAANIPVVAVDFGYTDVPVETLSPDCVISHFSALWEAVAGLGFAAGEHEARPLDLARAAP